jgi:hypothetical protein
MTVARATADAGGKKRGWGVAWITF